MSVFNTPILLIIYRRHVSLAAQIAILRGIRPARIYVFADGPRAAAEDADCRRARAALDAIDWPCDLRTRFQDANLGCGRGPAAALDWFFANEPEGIILEDDLLPHRDFFRFCAELLERFRDDQRIMEIAGTNRLGQWGDGAASYCFSRWGSECGWATWRRAWQHFDYNVRAWQNPESRWILRGIYRPPLQFAFYARILDRTARRPASVTWWDYQWSFAKNINHGLSVVPAVNLVRNVGCDQYSHHDRDVSHAFTGQSELPGIDFPLRHPKTIVSDAGFDAAVLAKAMTWRGYLVSFLPDGLRRRLRRQPGKSRDKTRGLPSLWRTQTRMALPPADNMDLARAWIMGDMPGDFISATLLERIKEYPYRPMRLEVARENLKTFKRVLDAGSVDFVLFFGTLLGAVRDNDLIGHDYDTDVLVMDDARGRLADVAAQLLAAGFEFVRCKNHGRMMTFMRQGEFIDIYVPVAVRRRFRQWCWNVDGTLISHDVLAEFITAPFLGGQFRVPRAYAQALMEMYGVDWRIPVKNRPAHVAFDMLRPYAGLIRLARAHLPETTWQWLKRMARR